MIFDDLPLFPLNTVLFPQGWLPLQIFEVRYLDLIKRCQARGEPFGVVCLRAGHEVRRAPAPGSTEAPTETLCEIGTMAHITEVVPSRAGLLHVQVHGGLRFSLEHAHVLPHGLWVGRAETLPPDEPVKAPPDLQVLSRRLQVVMQAMRDSGMPEPPAPDDPCWLEAGWLANRWAERLPIEPEQRQRLMTLDNPLWRLELAAEWLEQLSTQR
jgi:Lon protease-like protein